MSATDLEVRRAAFGEWAAMAARDVGDELVEYEMTHDRSLELAKRVRDHGFKGAVAGATRMRAWMGNPSRFDPTIDEVAVRRAVDFDWSAWEILTTAERQETIGRLAAMANPYEDPREDVLRQILAQHAATKAAPEATERTFRRVRWLAAPVERRNAITLAVTRARRAAAQAAQAAQAA